ncbi:MULTISPECIES: exodeoxyribonuclease III [Globicatella]|uniref:exodeoxyribonuclease III n=1 Tax=Globicatella TaxID=13075 RepID=UPI0008264758|nr:MULTISPECIES: exodeoxyribonuclease III [Globicatella]MDK7629789.1 exodeoxyribonuclease III [Globicatella sanguinis]OFK59721.1 exodeoxyribonuclease III [Globicatella sp. HMSC072A10]WIK67580.1 exodeoxyribonuclease III [Globicatella sanguinis]WKT56985.1 exodeoxyribonuclease III [Globicatella sanguinis]
MKLASWNVNGIRSVLNKGALQSYLEESNPDIICLQETKAQEDQVDFDFSELGYYEYWNSAVRKGYSGTAIFTKIKPLSVTYGIGIEDHDQEGRVITLEFADYYLVTVYTPNAKRDLTRLDYRQLWEDDFLAYLNTLNAIKPIVFCGDLNVAHQEIDLANPKTNTKNAGFTIEERTKFSQVIEAGYVDVFRYRNPEVTGAYTWWSYMNKARQRNVGWRIDYFVVSPNIIDRIHDVKIRPEVMGSDHCPIELEIGE